MFNRNFSFTILMNVLFFPLRHILGTHLPKETRAQMIIEKVYYRVVKKR